jgi:hypothetical protein
MNSALENLLHTLTIISPSPLLRGFFLLKKRRRFFGSTFMVTNVNERARPVRRQCSVS